MSEEDERRSLREWLSDNWQRIKDRGTEGRSRVRKKSLRRSLRQALWLSRQEEEKKKKKS
jgi:hypothetical protein